MAVFKPAQNSDDCYVTYNAGGIDLTANFIGMGATDFGGYSNHSGIRFLNVTIPKDATILTAIVTFQAQSDQSVTTCNILIKGELVADATTFGTYANFMGRTRTVANVPWNNIGAWTVDTDYDSPSVVDIIQEQVSQVTWASGNHLVLFFEDNASDAAAHRYGKSYDLSTTLCARLTVTWLTETITMDKWYSEIQQPIKEKIDIVGY